MSDRPNILLILADQLSYDCIAALGHTTVVTPNLDRLAAKSVRFRTAYCNNALCAPSRASFASGRYTHDIEVWDNAAEFAAGIPTIMHLLRHVGYRAVGAGKMHFVGPDQNHGFHERLTPELFPHDFTLNKLWSEGVPYNPGANLSKVKQAGVVPWDRYYDYDEDVLSQSCRFIRREAELKDDSPFFLTVSFAHPHPPFQALRRFWELYDDIEIPLPAVGESASHHLYDDWTRTQLGTKRWIVREEEIKDCRRAYYAMVSYVDECVGHLLSALEDSHLTDDTIVVFLADHGELLGEHGQWFKRTYYEESVRVPLFIAEPGNEGESRDFQDIVSLVDVSRTILDLAQVDVFPEYVAGLPGRSLVPILRGQEAAGAHAGVDRPSAAGGGTGASDESDPRCAVFEYSGKGVLNPMIGVREGRYKYVHVHNQPPLLFDLQTDPHEERDLAREKSSRGILEHLRSRIPPTWDGESLQRRIEESQLAREIVKTSGGRS
jgi:choline-sulfatase